MLIYSLYTYEHIYTCMCVCLPLRINNLRIEVQIHKNHARTTYIHTRARKHTHKYAKQDLSAI